MTRRNRRYAVYLPPAHGQSVGKQIMTEEELGEQVRDACAKLGWKSYWLRKTMFGAAGILDLLIVPVLKVERRHILHRELKGYSGGGRLSKTGTIRFPPPKPRAPRLGTLSDEQKEAIALINAAGGDAAMWEPEDWFSGKIIEELR